MNSRIFYRNSFLIENIVVLGTEKMVVKIIKAELNEIFVLDLKANKTIAKIVMEEQEFCWLSHLNQILIYQKSESNFAKEANCSLFTLEGILIKTVYSLNIDQYKVNSISYNKDNF